MTQSEQIILADAKFLVRAQFAIKDARGFILSVLTEAEHELDRASFQNHDLTLIPRLDLELRVDAREGNVAQQLGKALASRIIASMNLARPVGAERKARILSALASTDVKELVQQSSELEVIPDQTETSRRDDAISSSAILAVDQDAALLARLVAIARPVACLGQVARSCNLTVLDDGLASSDVSSILKRALVELRGLGLYENSGYVISSSGQLSTRLLDRARRFLIETSRSTRPDPQPDLSGEVIALAAIALAARFGIGAILTTQLWEPEASLSASPDVAQSIAAAVIAEQESSQPRQTRHAVIATSAQEPDIGSRITDATSQQLPPNPLESEIELIDPALSDSLETICLYSPHAGLAFLLPVLDALGLSAALSAVHPEPTFVVHRILRRMLELLAVPVDDEDPASYLLAGLLDAPSDDDRDDDSALWSVAECVAFARAVGRESTSYSESIDAWACALIDESRERLAESGPPTIDLTRDVIALRGDLTSNDEALTVTFHGFPPAYDALLRAGMLSDIAELDWLDGRALRFDFREEP